MKEQIVFTKKEVTYYVRLGDGKTVGTVHWNTDNTWDAFTMTGAAVWPVTNALFHKTRAAAAQALITESKKGARR